MSQFVPADLQRQRLPVAGLRIPIRDVLRNPDTRLAAKDARETG